MKNASKRLVGSIEELGRLYDFLNKEFFESALTKPLITLMPEDRKLHNARGLGWFSRRKVWNEKNGDKAYELNITADYADRSLLEIAGTLLHEMVHQFAMENDIDDCSRSGLYHNRKFAEIATEHGLDVKKNDKYGFSETRLSDAAIQHVSEFRFREGLIYRRKSLDKEEIVDILEKQIPEDTLEREKVVQDLYRDIREGRLKIIGDKVKSNLSSTRKYICPACRMSVRAMRVVNIKCGDCDIAMQSESSTL